MLRVSESVVSCSSLGICDSHFAHFVVGLSNCESGNYHDFRLVAVLVHSEKLCVLETLDTLEQFSSWNAVLCFFGVSPESEF